MQVPEEEKIMDSLTLFWFTEFPFNKSIKGQKHIIKLKKMGQANNFDFFVCVRTSRLIKKGHFAVWLDMTIELGSSSAALW